MNIVEKTEEVSFISFDEAEFIAGGIYFFGLGAIFESNALRENRPFFGHAYEGIDDGSSSIG
jgi:hypothetical protein